MSLERRAIPGRYRHYKGRDYRVTFLAVHHESRARFVIYVPLYGDGMPTIREFEDFFAEVPFIRHPDGVGQDTRFVWIGD